MVEIRQSSYMWQNVKLNRIQAVLLVALVRDGRLPDVDCEWSKTVSDDRRFGGARTACQA